MQIIRLPQLCSTSMLREAASKIDCNETYVAIDLSLYGEGKVLPDPDAGNRVEDIINSRRCAMAYSHYRERSADGTPQSSTSSVPCATISTSGRWCFFRPTL